MFARIADNANLILRSGFSLALALTALGASGSVIDLNPVLKAHDSFPTEFTKTGVLIGRFNQYSDEESGRDFIYDHGWAQVIGLGGGFSIINGFNGKGDIIGNANKADGRSFGFLWRDRKLTVLGAGNVSGSTAADINEKGDVVGDLSARSGLRRSVIWPTTNPGTAFVVKPADSAGTAINEADDVIGWYYPEGQTFTLPYLWRRGQITDLSEYVDLSAFDPSAFFLSISAQFLPQGFVFDVQGFNTEQTYITKTFVYQNGHTEELTFGGEQSRSTGHNSSGAVIGSASTPATEEHAFVWSDGKLTDLSAMTDVAFCVTGYGRFITDSGMVVFRTGGLDENDNWVGDYHYVYDNGQVTKLTLGGDSSWVSDVSPSGRIAGYATNPKGFTRAFVWQNGHIKNLGALGGKNSWAYDINSVGDVVGTCEVSRGVFHAFLYRNGVMKDLGVQSTNSTATLVSEDGQVAGYYLDAHGHKHTFVYTEDPLVAVQDSYVVGEGGTLSVDTASGVLANDTGTGLVASVAAQPQHGTLTFNADGSFEYQPFANYYGEDSFTYTASDGATTSAPMQVKLRVLRINDPPTANAGTDQTVNASGKLTPVFLVGSGSDVDGAESELSYSWSLHGQVLGDRASIIAYLPAGPHTLNLTVTDAEGGTGSDTVSVWVRYAWSGFLLSGTQFDVGSTIGVRFRLTDGSAGVTELKATLSYRKRTDTGWTDPQAIGRFNYYASNGLYTRMWDTTGLAPGTYELRADLGDGVVRTTEIVLQ